MMLLSNVERVKLKCCSNFFPHPKEMQIGRLIGCCELPLVRRLAIESERADSMQETFKNVRLM